MTLPMLTQDSETSVTCKDQTSQHIYSIPDLGAEGIMLAHLVKLAQDTTVCLLASDSSQY